MQALRNLGEAFHCQYKNSGNRVMIGALVKIGTTKVYVKGPLGGGILVQTTPGDTDVTVNVNNLNVDITSQDECTFVNVYGKVIQGTPRCLGRSSNPSFYVVCLGCNVFGPS